MAAALIMEGPEELAGEADMETPRMAVMEAMAAAAEQAAA